MPERIGTEYPTIPWGRAREEIVERSLRTEVQPMFFSENARSVFKWDADTASSRP